MKIYVSGKVTGEQSMKCQYKFGYISSKLREEGHKVINPVVLNDSLYNYGFSYEDIMRICYSAIDICDAVYMLDDWNESKGARLEHEYAINSGKKIIYQTAERMGSNA